MEKAYHSTYYKRNSKNLHAGDYVYVTGTIYTARDAKHISGWTKHWTEAKNYQLISKIRQFIIWDHHRQEKAVRLDLQVRQPPAVWTNMHHVFLILDRQQ